MFSTQQYFGFDPRTLPGCALWLDAADSNTVQYSSGSNISNWIDKSGNGRNFSNTNAGTQPTLETSGLSGTARHVLFNTTNAGYLTNSTFSGFSNTTFDMYSVIRLGTTSGYAAIFWGQPASLQMIIALGTGVNNGSNYALHTSGTWRLAPTEGYNSSAFANIYQFYSTGTQVGRRYQGYDFNGLTNQVATYSFPGFSASEVTFFRPVSGSWSVTPLRVGEVILFNRVLTATERQQMEGYLGWKWGIQNRYTTTTSFSPTSITGCQLWLDAADPSTFTPATPSNGALISQWNDKSGNARHVSNAATASQPRYRVGSNVTNGYPTVHFDSTSATGTNKGLLSNSTFTGLNTSNWNIFAAISVQSPGNAALLWDDQGGIDHITGCYTNGVALSNYLLHTSGVWRLAPTTGYVEPNVTRIIESYSTGAQVGRRVNGYFYGNVTDQSASYAFPTRTGNKTFYIANPSGGWSAGNLYVCELVIYNSVLSDSDRSNVQNYLRAKWGITDGIIPTSHPFYYNPTAMRVFQPIDISGCNLWLDAMDRTTFTPVAPADGTGITAWNDKSGSNYTFSRTLGTTNATYNAASNSLFFSTSNAGYSSSHPASVTNETLFMVVTSTLTNSVYVVGATGSGGRQAGFYADWTRIGNINSQTEWGAVTAPGSVVGGARILAISTVSSSSNLAVSANAGSFVTATLANPLGSNARTSTLAAEVTSPTYGGHIHEIIAYTRVLSTSERQQVEGYLGAKWGISSSFPTTQPYYLRRALPSTPLFTPTVLSGVALWLDAADPNGNGSIPSGGSSITTWTDKSGAGKNFTATGTVTFNTSPSRITLNGSSYLENTTITDSVFTVFYVYQKTSGSGALFTNNNTLNNTGFFPRQSGTGLTSITTSDSTFFQQASTIPDNSINNLVVQYDSSNNIYVHLNGTLNLQSTVAGTITRNRLTLGYRGANNDYMTGSYYEIVYFNRALTTAQRQQVEGYLAWKWGLQNSLPTTHPYYKFRP